MSNSSLITSMVNVRLLAANSGALGWESPFFSPSSPAIVVKGANPTQDHVFVGTFNGAIHKIGLWSGTQQGTFQTSGAVWGLAHSDNVVYANAGVSLVAYNIDPPNLLWTKAMDNNSWGSPDVSNGIVYSGSWDGKLYAIRTDGTPAWISSAFDFWAAQPIVEGGVVYAAAWEKLVALDATTGSVIWQSSTPNGATITSPVCFGDGRVYVGTAWGGLLCAFDASNGNELWSSNFGGHPTPPTYRAGRVFAAAEHGAGDGYLKSFDAADGHLLWTSQVPVGNSGDAVSRAEFDGLFDHHVFVASQNGTVYAFQRSSGTLVWQAGVGSVWPNDPKWTEPTEKIMPWNLDHVGEYRTIDPLALVLRGDIYVKLNLPYPLPLEAVVVRVRQSAQGMSENQKRMALKQLSNLDMVSKVLKEAITMPKEQRAKSNRKMPKEQRAKSKRKK
jgi:outer membrane protein assembly factor BamB